MDRLSLLCAGIALCGLFLVYWFSPGRVFAEKTPFELAQDCSGFVKVSGRVSGFFFTKTGRPAAEMSGLLVLLKNSELEDSSLLVYGKAGLHGGRCWILAERVEHA